MGILHGHMTVYGYNPYDLRPGEPVSRAAWTDIIGACVGVVWEYDYVAGILARMQPCPQQGVESGNSA